MSVVMDVKKTPVSAYYSIIALLLLGAIAGNLYLAATCHHWHQFLPTQGGPHTGITPTDSVHTHVHDHARTTNSNILPAGADTVIRSLDHVPFETTLFSGTQPVLVDVLGDSFERTLPQVWWLMNLTGFVIAGLILTPPEKPP